MIKPVFQVLILFSAPIILVNCAPQRSLTAELQPYSLHALNLEETVGRRDDVMLAYSLTAYDAANKAVSVVSGAWGVGTIRKNQTLTLTPDARPISLVLPRNGRIVASVVLIEVDKYTKASETLSRIQTIQNIASVPVGLLVSATDVLTPLNYVMAGLAAAGLGVQFTDHFDTSDVLGQSSSDINEADTRRSGQRLMRIPARFEGQHLRNTYRYELTYDVLMKTVKLKASL